MAQPLEFAHFEVLARSDGSPHVLGQGAMGVTYKALDKNLLSLAVIKVPASEQQLIPAARQRFLQEAQMMARLRHPHVANVFYFGESPSGAFYAMEFCDGPSLQEYIAHHGSLTWTEVFQLGLQIASALQALDAHELVHRDLKPSNVVLTADSAGAAHLKVIDFGVAREGLPTDTGGLTGGGFIGTPAYASPEQLLEAVHIDSRSDLYSLGAVLWFCLTGHPPFEGTQFEVMFHHVNTEPEWGDLPDMPEEALVIMKRLLAKSAEGRYASPAALVEALQTLTGAGHTARSVHLRRLSLDTETAETSGYEPVTEVGADSFGKVWSARDILSDRLVALRYLPSEFAGKQGLILRLQRLVAFVRSLEHPRWLKVWHFEQQGNECRLATELVAGPTVLALLKARQQLPLEDALPLLVQLAEAMDFAANQSLTAMETAPERLPLLVEGWTAMGEEARGRLLRTRFEEWPSWSVKVCPLRLSASAQDYVLPTDTEAAQAIARISFDFVQLCHRLLTGQGRSQTGYVPSPLLSEEGNTFFEKHYSPERMHGIGCGALLRQLCLSEGVNPRGVILDDAGSDPFATRPIERSGKSAPRITAAPKTPSSPKPPRRPSEAPTISFGDFAGLAMSDTFMGGADDSVSGPPSAVSTRLREIEERRAALEVEAEQLKADEKLQAEREWLVAEREALEKSRREMVAREEERLRRLEDDSHRLAEQRKALEQQQSLLEDKRREQQRLEQEIQLRAQVEFQKLQEQAQAREQSLLSQRAALEEALRSRESDFQIREKQSLDRLAKLKEDAAAIESIVADQSRTMRHMELEQTRRRQEVEDEGGLAKDKFAAEERKIAELRRDLDVRLADFRVGQRRRFITLCLTVIVVGLVATAAFVFIRGQVRDFRSLPGAEQWQASLQERKATKSDERWADLLNWCTATEEALRADPSFTATLHQHQEELTDDAQIAIKGLLAQSQLPSATSGEGRLLLLNLDKVENWGLSLEHQLLQAKLRIPEAVARASITEAMESYIKTANLRKDFIAALKTELATILEAIHVRIVGEELPPIGSLLPLLGQIIKLQPEQELSDAARVDQELLAEEARRGGKPEESLRILVRAAQSNQSWIEPLRPQAVSIINQLSSMPSPSLLNLQRELRSGGDIWKNPNAYVALANLQVDDSVRIDDYRQADKLGSLKARALLGRTLLDTGVKQRRPDLIDQGIAKLRSAVEGGEPEAMVLLGEALYAGQGVKEDAAAALDLAEQAEAKGHPEAFYVKAKAKLRLAELARDPEAFEEASKLLEKAMKQNLPSAAFFLYIANYNESYKRPDRAVAALEKGAASRDSNCLYTLGIWLTAGLPPVSQNVSRGRQLIEEAANLGNRKALDWLRKKAPVK